MGRGCFVLRVGTTILTVIVISYFVSRDIYLASARIQDLEKEINSVAGHDLLRWESEWGMGAKTHLIGKAIRALFDRSV